jgi:acetyl esterase/lipase
MKQCGSKGPYDLNATASGRRRFIGMRMPRLHCGLIALLIFSAVWAQQKLSRPEPTEKQTYKTLGERNLEIWVYKPKDWKVTDKRSAIVFYHGGGWSKGDPSAFSRQCAALSQRGMIAMTVRYRLTSEPGVQITDCVRDAKSAFRWARQHAPDLGIDPNKIAAGGGSAGGHLAAALATIDDVNDEKDDLKISARPACLVLFNPAVQLSWQVPNEKPDATNARLSVSPYHHLKAGTPPTIIFHGEEDTTVPIKTVRDYASKVKELGGECTVVGFAGQKHSFFNREPFTSDTLKQAEAFLEDQGLLKKS